MVLLFSFLLLIQGNVAVLYLASGEKLGYWTEKRQEIPLFVITDQTLSNLTYLEKKNLIK